MAGKRPVFTENFSGNLSAIQSFLGTEGAHLFQRLLDRLFDKIVPTLCQFPRSGRTFLTRAICSSDAKSLVRKLRIRLKRGDDLREFIVNDYLVLYLIRDLGASPVAWQTLGFAGYSQHQGAGNCAAHPHGKMNAVLREFVRNQDRHTS